MFKSRSNLTPDVSTSPPKQMPEDSASINQLVQNRGSRSPNYVLSMQRHLGNSATMRYLQRTAEFAPQHRSVEGQTFLAMMPRGTIRPIMRDIYDDVDTSTATEEATLTNSRFMGIKDLEDVLKGTKTIKKPSSGKAVQAIQQALFDMNYPLPRYLVDKHYGGESEEAVRQFREDCGLPVGEGVDKQVLLALDKKAPLAGQTAGKSMDYSKILADNKLTITIGVGYDEKNSHPAKIEEARQFFLGKGFTSTVDEASKLESFTKKKTFKYIDPSTNQEVSRDVDIIVRLVTPSTANAKDEFGKGLSQDDVTIYSGHARYGTGPDFDDSKDPAQNFVVGVGAALHKSGVLKEPPDEPGWWYKGHRETEKLLEKRKNDIEALTESGQMDPEKYRVWFFAACSTIHYLDEFRNEEMMGGQTRKNLDIIGTRSPIYTDISVDTVLRFIDGIMSMETMDQIMAGMQGKVDEMIDRVGDSGFKEMNHQFFTDGFGDNPVITVAP